MFFYIYAFPKLSFSSANQMTLRFVVHLALFTNSEGARNPGYEVVGMVLQSKTKIISNRWERIEDYYKKN